MSFEFTGTDHDGGGWIPHLVAAGYLPPPPSYTSSLPRVLTPMPRLLDPTADDEGLAKSCGEAYRAVMSAATRRKSHAFTRGKPSRWKQFDLLVAWSRLMLSLEREKQIPTVLWLRWRLDRFATSPAARKGAMPPGFAYSLGALDRPQNRGWCRRDYGDPVRREIASKELRELRAKYGALRREILLRLTPDSTGSEVRAVVAEFFPGDSYDAAWAAAAKAQRKLQAKIDRAAEAGDLRLWFPGRVKP